MLKIEPHSVLPDRQVVVWYQDGKRKAVIYVDPAYGLHVVYEADVDVRVERRTGPTSFEVVKD